MGGNHVRYTADEKIVAKDRSETTAMRGAIIFCLVLGVLFATLGSLGHHMSGHEDELATSVDQYVRDILPTLRPEDPRDAPAPIGTYVLWYTGDGLAYVGGIEKFRPTGGMREYGGTPWWTVPRFENLKSLVIVRGTVAISGRYSSTRTLNAPLSPSLSWSSTVQIDSYDFQVWVIDVASRSVVAYRPFPAAPLKAFYSNEDLPERMDLEGLRTWVDALESSGKTSAGSTQ